MPPVGMFVSAFRVMTERSTISRHSRFSEHPFAHFLHQVSVDWSARIGLILPGTGPNDGDHVSVKARLWSFRTTNSE